MTDAVIASPGRQVTEGFGWFAIFRMGLVQTGLGSIVVLMTSTINRVMVVEMALPAIVPGVLFALYYGMQMLRPRWGYGSDGGASRTPWIIGGMATLATGGMLAASATALASVAFWPGMLLAVLAFFLVGVGVGCAGTSLLAMLATRVAPHRRAAAATIVWVMMIAGFAITAPIAGHYLDPFSPARLLAVTSVICVAAFLLSSAAVIGVERSAPPLTRTPDEAAKPPFREAIAQVWAEPVARRFTIFIFVSMFAYNVQELILEPYAGLVFGLTLGETTKLSGMQHGGVLSGMILVAVAATAIGGAVLGSLRAWMVVGCLGSAAALLAVAAGGSMGDGFPLRAAVFGLGLFNGIFAVAAIGSMMGLAATGTGGREGTRMGLWGAAQAIAFGAGGFLGTVMADLGRLALGSPYAGYASVFALEAGLFLVAAWVAASIGRIALPTGGFGKAGPAAALPAGASAA